MTGGKLTLVNVTQTQAQFAFHNAPPEQINGITFVAFCPKIANDICAREFRVPTILQIAAPPANGVQYSFIHYFVNQSQSLACDRPQVVVAENHAGTFQTWLSVVFTNSTGFMIRFESIGSIISEIIASFVAFCPYSETFVSNSTVMNDNLPEERHACVL